MQVWQSISVATSMHKVNETVDDSLISISYACSHNI